MRFSHRSDLANSILGYKEDSSKGAMLRFEDSLPKLPVPTLEETAKRYLKSVHCLLTESEFQHTKTAVEEFVSSNGLGPTLQKRLEARAADPNMKNWLTEWWNNAAYLAYRDPVSVFRQQAVLGSSRPPDSCCIHFNSSAL